MALSNNVSNLTAEVARLCRDKGITAVDETDYIDALNNAQDTLSEMLKLFHKRTLSDSAAGAYSYAVPTDYMAMYAKNSVRYTDEEGDIHTVYQTTYDEVRDYDDLLTATGTPSKYWIDGDTIQLYPSPDYTGTNNISIEHYHYVPDLGGGTTAKTDIKYVTEDYIVLSADTNVFANGTLTLTLPSAVDNGSMEVTLKNVGTGTVTVTPQSGQVIDGEANYYLSTQYESLTVKSDAVNWFITRKV